MDVETIFAAAIGLASQDERKLYLDQACGENPALRHDVEGLLQAHVSAGSFIQFPAVGVAPRQGLSEPGTDKHDSTAAQEVCELLEPCETAGRIGKLGAYEIIEVVGSGGMGTVLRGFDVKLRRVVAVKVLSPQLAASGLAVKKFLREAQSAAAIHHDHVVTVHAVEDQHRPPFLVMEFIQGRTLQQKIEQDGDLELKQILRIGAQAAAGLAAAHKQGLIHRDVKPANILLENGVERVKITDFGLARAADDVAMTGTGVVAGTPQYMSPEQAKGETVDFRSDLFSLGSVLYTMCAGRPAFRPETTMGVLRRVCDDSPTPLATVNPQIPDWLAAIVMRLLEKDPSNRFQTADETATLLEQCLAHVQSPNQVPLPAFAVDLPGKTAEPTGWHRSTYWIALVVVLLLVPLVGLLAIGGDARSALFAALGGSSNAPPDLAIQNESVKRSSEAPEVLPSAAKLTPRIVLKEHSSWVQSLTFSPDGKTLATGSNDQFVRLFDAKTGEVTGNFHGDDGVINSLSYSPNGTLLASCSGRPQVRVWNATTFSQLAEAKHDGGVSAVAFCGDSLLATATWGGTVRLWKWDGTNLALVKSIGDRPAHLSTLSFNPEGTVIATVSSDGELSLWDVESGELLKSANLGEPLICLAFSPDGKTIAAGGFAKSIELRHADTLVLLGTLRGTQEWVHALVFLGDGKTLVSAGGHFDPVSQKSNRPGELKLWDVAGLRERLSVPGYEAGVKCLALSPDGKTLATGDFSRLARLWDVDALLAAAGVQEGSRPVLRLQFAKGDFYEKEGKTYVRDRSGKGNDGLCEQVEYTPQGKTGGGLENAGKGFLRLPSSLIAGKANFTIAGWVKPRNLDQGGCLYLMAKKDYPTAALEPRFSLSYHPKTHLFAGAWNDLLEKRWIQTTSETLTVLPEEWLFIAAALEEGGPGRGRLRLMLNDRVVERPLQQVSGVGMIAFQDIVGVNLEGVVDELTVWDRALPEAELRELFARPQEQTPGPVLQMHFAKADFYEKDGKTYVRDRSGKGNDGLCEQVEYTPQGKTGGGLANAGEGLLRLPSSLIAGKSNFTIAGWVKSPVVENIWSFYGVNGKAYPTQDSPTFNLWIRPGPDLYAAAWNNTPKEAWMETSVRYERELLPEAWRFIAVGLEEGGPGKGRLRLMLNEQVWERPFQQIGNGGNAIQDIVGWNLEGVLDELTVWDRALPEADLREIFARGK